MERRHAGEIVELRVHGVHGTSPSVMLGVDGSDVGQVAGDTLTGVYRSKSGTLPYRATKDTGVSIEAYSWGALTSGVQGLFGWVQRALWLLLLPFALANLSYWARLHLAEDTAVARWGARAVRLGALLLTVFMVLTPCLVGVDLIAWQCYRGGSPGCAALPGSLSFLARMDAADRLAVGSLLPLAVLGLLWFLSRQSMARYEEVTSSLRPGSTGDVLRHPKLWRGRDRTLQLQRIHLAVGLAVVVGFSGVHVLQTAAGTPSWILITVVVAAAVGVCGAAWLCLVHPDDIDYFEHPANPGSLWNSLPEGAEQWVRSRGPETLLRVAAGLTVVHLLALLWLSRPLDDAADFYGHNLWFIGVFVLLTAVHLAIFTGGRMPAKVALGVVAAVFLLGGLAILANTGRVFDSRAAAWVAGVLVAVLWVALVAWHYLQGRRHAAEAWNGAGASVMLAAAAWVALLFCTGLVTVTANFLNGSEHGVDDLVSRSSAKARAAAEALPTGAAPVQSTLPVFQASGEVTAKDAVVLVGTTGGVQVVRGTVESESLFQPSPESTGARAGLWRALDSTRVDEAAVRLPTPTLGVQDSCVRPVTSTDLRCSAESADFVPAGSLPLRRALLRVDAGIGHRVTLAVAEPPQMPLVVPQVLIWSPVVQLAWLLAAVVVGLGALVVFRRAGRDIDGLVDADDIPLKDRAASRKARRTAALAHRAERLLDAIGAVTAVAALALICLCATGRAPWDLWPWTRNIATLSMYVAAALCLALIFLASRLRRSDRARKGVGILWDLTTFWPRAAHPLAPPCYAERVVPELRTRASWVLHSPPGAPADETGGDPRRNNRLVLSGHSQGSAILVAVVSRLPRRDLARVRVVTYGSQIRAFYGRIFPAVMGPTAVGYVRTPGPARFGNAFPDVPAAPGSASSYDVLPASPQLPDEDWEQLPLFDRVFTAGGSWHNLFRRSDPLGFRVFSDTDQSPDHYVPEVPQRVVGDPGPQVMTHGGYQHTAAYRALLAEWSGETVVADPPGTVDLPTLPPG